MKWVCATVAPWAVAAGVLVSFTAAAGNDPRSGVSTAARSVPGLLTNSSLVPASGLSATPRLRGAVLGALMPQGGLRLDDGDEPESSPRTLKAVLKSEASAPPEVARARKGDPARSLAPSLSRRAAELHASLSAPGMRLVFARDERVLPPTILMQGTLEAPEAEQAFEPWQYPELTTTKQTSSVQSPAAAAAGSTGAAVGSTTPSVGRAIALSSATPAPLEATPMEIAAAPVAGMQSARLDLAVRPENPFERSLDPDRPRYADLIDPDNLERERRCLAEAVYFEARSEPEEGQAAVAQVVLNRVRSGLYPSSICGVVYQNRHRHLACQFTFACEGKSLRITDRESWASARRVAESVLEGRTYLADVGSSTHYHADYVRPRWASKLKKMDVIGRHIFYKLRPGQT
ncbi:MAG TPA: cell wall hydrolase [Microvirga sp.]|jgi:spore germination cell wall hydrolase CwlJ-like protein|nr:cell wall hydrolase [Microvirga sp.]